MTSEQFNEFMQLGGRILEALEDMEDRLSTIERNTSAQLAVGDTHTVALQGIRDDLKSLENTVS